MAGSLALLAVLVTLAGGVTIAAAAGARRADSAFQRFVDATGEPDVQADGFASPQAWTPESGDGATVGVRRGVGGPECRAVASAWPPMAVAATPEADAFAFAFVEQRGEPADPFMVEGRMFDPDDPHEVLVNEAGAARSASASATGSCSRPSVGISSTTTSSRPVSSPSERTRRWR